MSSGYLRGGSSTRGPSNYSPSMSPPVDDSVPANVIVRAGKNLRETIDPTEEFLLPAGEKRVVMKCDKNDPTTAIFTFNRDGQTLGGLLVSALLALPCVIFAAYKVPHPLFFVFELRLTTDGSMDPKEALLEASKNMVEDLVMLGRRFTHEWELLKQAEMAGGVGSGDIGQTPGRASYTRAVSRAEEAVGRSRSFQGGGHSQQDTRYQFFAGSPGRPSYQGHGSPVRVGYQGGDQQGIRSLVGLSSPWGAGYLREGQSTGYQGGARSPEKLDIQTGGDRGGSNLHGHGMSGYRAGGLQGNTYQGVGNSEAGFQASWASGQQASSPDRMSHQGSVKAGSPLEGSYRTGAAAVSDRPVNWGDGSQGLGGSGYQFGGQQASTTQAGDDRTSEYQRANNQGWDQHRRQKEDADIPKDTAMEDNDW